MIHTPEAAVPNTVCVTFPDVEGEAVLLALDLEGIAVATGSACSSGAAEPSHVLQAMGLTREQAERSIRISFHAQSCAEDVAACVDSLARVVKRLRALHV
jgi:cysteine desulfurase